MSQPRRQTVSFFSDVGKSALLAFSFLLGEFKTHFVFTEEGQKNQ